MPKNTAKTPTVYVPKITGLARMYLQEWGLNHTPVWNQTWQGPKVTPPSKMGSLPQTVEKKVRRGRIWA